MRLTAQRLQEASYLLGFGGPTPVPSPPQKHHDKRENAGGDGRARSDASRDEAADSRSGCGVCDGRRRADRGRGTDGGQHPPGKRDADWRTYADDSTLTVPSRRAPSRTSTAPGTTCSSGPPRSRADVALRPRPGRSDQRLRSRRPVHTVSAPVAPAITLSPGNDTIQLAPVCPPFRSTATGHRHDRTSAGSPPACRSTSVPRTRTTRPLADPAPGVTVTRVEGVAGTDPADTITGDASANPLKRERRRRRDQRRRRQRHAQRQRRRGRG